MTGLIVAGSRLRTVAAIEVLVPVEMPTGVYLFIATEILRSTGTRTKK
jgi:hypothetical protein